MKKKCILFSIIVVTISSALAKTGREIIDENNFKTSVAPLLTTEWSQENGENCLLPYIDAEGRRHAKAGCGAIAMAQVMNFWKYPPSGHSNHYYYWDYLEDIVGAQLLTADFEHTNYDWENMIARYEGNESVSEIQLQAIGTLISHIGVALEMKYDEDSTATMIEYISSALKKYFLYNENMILVRQSHYDIDEWRRMVYKELSEGRPVLMGGTWMGVNHLFVADGYDEEGLVHFNLGHANRRNEDKYYDLESEGITYTSEMRMLLGLCPENIEMPLTEAYVNQPGSLLQALGGEREAEKISRLKLIGPVNEEDVELLRRLSDLNSGQLSYLDMSEVSFPDYTLPENAFSTDEYNHACYALQKIILPENMVAIDNRAFRNCRGLLTINFPASLERLGDYVFSDCRYLENIELPANLQEIGGNPFRYVKLDKFTIHPDNHFLKIENGALISPSKKILYSYPVKLSGEFHIPEGIRRIWNCAFLSNPLLEKVHIPASVEKINSNAFLNCYNLKEVYSYANESPALSTSSGLVFYPENKVATLHIPHGCLASYQLDEWGDFAETIDDLEEAGSVEIIQNKNVIATHYFNLEGQEIETFSHGVFIKIETLNDNSRRVSKIIL